MIIIEKINENIFLGTRENAGWEYRCIIETKTELEIGQQISSESPIECKIKSLCCASQLFFFGEYSEDVDLSERAKVIFLEVISGDEDAEWAKSFVLGNAIN